MPKQSETQAQPSRRLRGRTAIAGIGETGYMRRSSESLRQLLLNAVEKALDDSGLERRDVDAIITEGGLMPRVFPYDEMAKLVTSIGLVKNVALPLIRKSYQLFKLRPHLEKASARYDQRQGSPEKQLDSMNSALKELLLKSAESATESASDPEIEEYLKNLTRRLK